MRDLGPVHVRLTARLDTVAVRLSYPANAVVVVAGLPGAGKSTLIRRVVDRSAVEVVDTDDQRRDGGRASYVRHYGRILAAVRGSRPVVIHSRGTVGTLRRAIALVAALHGKPAHLILLDASWEEAEDGQRKRGRGVSRARMDRELRRWRRLRGRGPRREGWTSVIVLDRPTAAVAEPLQWKATYTPGTTGFDVVGSWGWSRVEVPEAS
jgi:predicted kinase